jgi:SAM-dependent methyltransferase
LSDDGRGLKFGTVAENYDRYRPSPPRAAAALLGDVADLEVLDVGAGTGKFTRLLIELGTRVSVVEPDDDMRRVLLRRSPDVTVLMGRAEELPAAESSFDVVVSSSAWHWFTQPDATNEMGRVLRDDGSIFVLWNGFSRDVPWMVELSKFRQRPDDANARPRGWRAQFNPDGPFVDARDVSFNWTWRRTIDDVVALFGTYTGAIIQSEENRETMRRLVRERLVEHAIDGVVELPMTLRGTTARRRPR